MAGGRPTKLTDEVIAKICDALKAGNTRKAAAAYGGVHVDSFYAWMNEFSEFSEAVKKAEADCEVAHVAIVKKAGTGYDVLKRVTKSRIINGVEFSETTETATREFSWQASAWWLERRRPEDYARFVLDPSKLSADTLAELQRHLSGGESPGDRGEGRNGASEPPAAAGGAAEGVC